MREMSPVRPVSQPFPLLHIIFQKTKKPSVLLLLPKRTATSDLRALRESQVHDENRRLRYPSPGRVHDRSSDGRKYHLRLEKNKVTTKLSRARYATIAKPGSVTADVVYKHTHAHARYRTSSASNANAAFGTTVGAYLNARSAIHFFARTTSLNTKRRVKY